MTNKIKLSPEQEAFALKIGATHYEEPPEQLMGISGTYWKREGGCVMWHTISGWISSHYGCMPEGVMPIDFTQSQEVDWKALAMELADSLNELGFGQERSFLTDLGTQRYRFECDCNSLRKVERAMRRAKDAGL